MAKWIKPLSILFILITFFVLILTGCVASQQTTTETPTQATRDPVLESTLVSQLTTMNTAAVPVYQDATTALDAGDLNTAKTLYEKVSELAPNFSTAYRRLGSIYLDNNDYDSAIEQLRKAMAIEPNAYNQSALALALLSKNTPKDNQESFNLASEAAKTLPNDESTVLTWLLSSANMEDEKNIREADERLLQINPTDPYAQYFAGLISATDGKWEKAKKEMLYAQQLGMPANVVKHAMDAGISRNALLARLLRWGLIAMGCWLLGLALLYLIGMALSRATLKALRNPQPVSGTQIKPEESRIRSIYRSVVRLLSLYYYISIPFVILLLFLYGDGNHPDLLELSISCHAHRLSHCNRAHDFLKIQRSSARPAIIAQ
jgi:tetratricopeptide (TPR) repeat protein